MRVNPRVGPIVIVRVCRNMLYEAFAVIIHTHNCDHTSIPSNNREVNAILYLHSKTIEMTTGLQRNVIEIERHGVNGSHVTCHFGIATVSAHYGP